MSGQWSVVIRGDWYLPHLVNMLSEYRGNAEQTSCRDEVIAQIESQIIRAEGVGKERTRPLVVIDPEDREQVERLLSTYLDQGFRSTPKDAPIRTTGVDYLQAALREFANPTPPKPDEPQGLGAVVRDADGKTWVKVGKRSDWYQAHGKWAQYHHIDAVEVLSEGVIA